MYSLPANIYVQSRLKFGIRLALFPLPFLGIFAAFATLYSLRSYGDASTAWAAKYIVIFAFTSVLVIGYLLGWLCNAVVLRILGCPWIQVSRALLRSRVPSTWIAPHERTSDSAIKLAIQLENWKNYRRGGPIKFLLRSWKVHAIVLAPMLGLSLLQPKIKFTLLFYFDLFALSLLISAGALLVTWGSAEQWYEFHTRVEA